jgi:hypothetical protein
MGTLERTETLTHRIGTDGRVSVKAIGGTLRVRGTDGDEARLSVTYRIRAESQDAAERALDSGRVLVDRGPGSLEVETPERRLATGIAWLFGGARVNADITVEVPWGARVRLETMSGSVEAVNLVGDQKYRTVSGEVRMWGLGGIVEAGSISGSVMLDRGGDIRLRANTVSGRVSLRAARFHGLIASTTSGSVTVTGAFDPAGDYRAESISGGVEITPLSGVAVELRSISGSINSDIEHRIEGGRGSWRTIVGDGASRFKVNSTSGGLRLRPPSTADHELGRRQPAPAQAQAPAPAAGPAAPWTTAVPATEPAPVPEGAAASAAEPSATGAAPSEETWNPAETPEDAPAAQDRDAAEDELAILQALERGEIGVEEASERLERARR